MSDKQDIPAPSADSSEEFYDLVRGALEQSNTGGSKEFIDAVQQVATRYPDRAESYYLLGIVAYELSDAGRAIELITQALEIDECSDYADALATLYTLVGQLADGLYHAKLATTLDPHPTIPNLLPFEFSNYFRSLSSSEPSQHYLNALIAFHRRFFDVAMQRCEMELRINKEHPDAFALLGRCQMEMGSLERAVASFHAAVHFEPDVAEHRIYLAEALFRLGRFEEALACQAAAVRLEEANPAFAAVALSGQTISGAPNRGTPLHRELERRLALDMDAPAARATERQAGILRVGYISDAAHDGEIGRFLEMLVLHHDLSRVETHIYMQSITNDATAAQLKSASTSWRSTFDLDDDLLAMIIRNDGIDVLVDLTGYSMGSRLGVIAQRPAPVQLCLMRDPYGYGQPGINTILSDIGTRDLDEAAASKDQMVIDVAVGLHGFHPFTVMPDPSPLPAESNGYITFGGICDLSRLTPDVVSTWSALLKRVPGSKVLLGGAPMLPGRMKEQIFEYFSHHGCADRLMFWNAPLSSASLGEFMQYVDLYLDTWPMGGRLDIAEALWMGVPVISLKGPSRSSRNGASMLFSAGCLDWIADDSRDFIDRAVAVATDVAGLSNIREGLRGNIKGTALFSPIAVTRGLEEAYMQAMQQATDSENATHKSTTKRSSSKGAAKKIVKKSRTKKAPVNKKAPAKRPVQKKGTPSKVISKKPAAKRSATQKKATKKTGRKS